jgi:hypothetical protein
MSLIGSGICFGDSCGFCRRMMDSVLYCGVLVFIWSLISVCLLVFVFQISVFVLVLDCL